MLLETAPTGTGELVSVVDAWAAIEKAVPREKLAEDLAVIAEVIPDEEGDEDAEWRAALATRYGTGRGFRREVSKTPPITDCNHPCSLSNGNGRIEVLFSEQTPPSRRDR
ncbi:hypothetical protein [Streptomyces sp. NPDC002209]|uniref:hypothetical protein n=1 Tax=Streptomyces sp. NPDC002209 TaxID=3364638 RepID=UPI0036C57396